MVVWKKNAQTREWGSSLWGGAGVCARSGRTLEGILTGAFFGWRFSFDSSCDFLKTALCTNRRSVVLLFFSLLAFILLWARETLPCWVFSPLAIVCGSIQHRRSGQMTPCYDITHNEIDTLCCCGRIYIPFYKKPNTKTNNNNCVTMEKPAIFLSFYFFGETDPDLDNNLLCKSRTSFTPERTCN